MYNQLSMYSIFCKNAVKERFAYRFKAIMWSLSSLFNMLVQFYLWKSIYHTVGGDFMGIAENNYLVYVASGVICYSMVSCMENMAIAEEIKSGNIAMYLIKPIRYRWMTFARHLGGKLADLIGLIPILIIVGLLLHHVDMSVGRICLFLLSVVLAFVVSFLFAYVIGLFTFWTTNYWGIQFLTGTLMGLLSGQLMAIDFYVELGRGMTVVNPMLTFLNSDGMRLLFRVLAKLAYCMPFQSMYYTPMSIVSGIIAEPKSIAFHILLQLLWIVILGLLGNLMWRMGRKKLEILGG